MKKFNTKIALLIGMGLFSSASIAVPFIQCQGDEFLPDGVTAGKDGIPDVGSTNYDPNVKCLHLSSGDGFARMADGREMYIFGYSDITGSQEKDAMAAGSLAAMIPAPAIVLEEGQQFYLSLTNAGMIMRPDLSDAHTVHFHGFPNASSIFDGVPDVSVSVNMGSTLTYFYNVASPGTYMYHCHVEAAEHMQMGMLGNLYVKPQQNKLVSQAFSNGFAHVAGNQYVYNDEDGSTLYDVEFPIQITSIDSNFHDANELVQPLPFANMKDNYPLLNGRGYPDTVVTTALPAPTGNGGKDSQIENALVSAQQGQKILLRISSLSTTEFYSLRLLGMDMKVVGMGASQLRGPDPDGNGAQLGPNNFYTTNTLTLGGGESVDVIIDTTNVAPGTYFLYSSNLNNLSNNMEDYGGMMTEIVITAAGGV